MVAGVGPGFKAGGHGGKDTMTQALTKRGRQAASGRIRSREATITHILDAAHQIVANAGLAGLSMRQLGSAVGLNAASLYGYFPSKDAVIEGLFVRQLRAMHAVLDIARQSTPPGRERLLALGAGYRRYALEHPDYQQVFQSILDGTPDNAERWREVALGAVFAYAGDVEEAIRLGELPPGIDARTAVLHIWIALAGYVDMEARRCIGGAEPGASAAFRAYLDMVLAGITAIGSQVDNSTAEEGA